VKVLHFSADEKFMALTQDLFEEAFPAQNTFVFVADEDRPIRFVRQLGKVKVVDTAWFASPAVAEEMRAADLLVVHGMRLPFAQALLGAPARLRVVWCAWGFDYYSALEGEVGDILLPRTSAMTQRSRGGVLKKLRGRLARVFGGRKASAVHGRNAQKEALVAIAGRIDVININPCILGSVRKVMPELRARAHTLNYYTTENTFAPGPPEMSGPDILLGNSATATNNHVEAIELLGGADLKGRKVLVPLSYGREAYADMVSRLGRRVLGRSFVPLRQFLPLEQYNRVISTCGTVIMNHRRLQGMGNVSVALYKGARVYVRSECPVHDFYSRMGAVLSAIDRADPASSAFFQPLEPHERAVNAKVVGGYWSRERSIRQIRELATFV
jgi:dTDP-N-acetylfucosamine:lipid II N-acetylfucosaminyltransferase